MLNQLLVLLETGGTWQVADLAAALDTSPELVNAMLSHLAQHGKLAVPDQSCIKPCMGCSMASACKTRPNRTFVYVSRTPKPSEQP
jgi:Mn-dependent DtxR family transcriptional regulator